MKYPLFSRDKFYIIALCDQCDNKFVLKWPLRKHKEGHANLSQKHCKLFNNMKNYPFEEVGCKFMIQNYEFFLYREHCKANIGQIDKNDEKAVEELTIKFQKSNWFEAKKVVCSYPYCKASYGFHKFCDQNYEAFVTFSISLSAFIINKDCIRFF